MSYPILNYRKYTNYIYEISGNINTSSLLVGSNLSTNPNIVLDVSGQVIIRTPTTRIGINAGQTNQDSNAIAIGNAAGRETQGSSAIAIGNEAGQTFQGSGAIAIGSNAGSGTQDSNAIAICTLAGQSFQGYNAIAIGFAAGRFRQGISSIAIGNQAGNNSQGTNAVSVGSLTGQVYQRSGAVAIGYNAGNNTQGTNAVAIGIQAGNSSQGTNAVAIGNEAGTRDQSANAIAIGFNAGWCNQRSGAIAIGYQAGYTIQGENSIAIGTLAGFGSSTGQAANSIVINALGTGVTAAIASATYIAPLRTGVTATTNYGVMLYSAATNEVLYSANQTSAGSKTFVIPHPTNDNKYLVHACLEGPETAVFYRGKGEITDNSYTTINLPYYASLIAKDFTVQINPIYDGTIKNYNTSEVENNSFNVFGVNGKFHWLVHGKRQDIEVEPDKNKYTLNSKGPYTWLSKN